MSYNHTLLSNHSRTMFSCSVPPPSHEKLSKTFKEISRIHFYFGHVPIGFMVDEVESSNDESIYLGMPQLAFSVKELLEFVPFNNYAANNEGLSYFMNKMFNDICKGLNEIILEIKKNPSCEDNILIFNTMGLLFAEVEILNRYAKIESTTVSNTQDVLNKAYLDINNLKIVYPVLNDIISWDILKQKAEESIKAQLSKEFSFNMSELSLIYDLYNVGDSWVQELRYMIGNITENPEGYKKETENIERVRSVYVKNMRSFSLVLQNGLINYLRSFIVSISVEEYRAQSRLKVDGDAYYARKKNFAESMIGYSSKRSVDMYKEQLEDLKNNKEKFLKDFRDEKKKIEHEIFNIEKMENTIKSFIEIVKEDMIGTCKKEVDMSNVIKVKRNIENGRLVAEYKDKIIYGLSEEFGADVKMFVFSIDKESFKSLSDSDLSDINVVSKKINQFDSVKTTNFPNMPELLKSLRSDFAQSYFLGVKGIEVIEDLAA